MRYLGKIGLSGAALLALGACAKTENPGLPELPPAENAPLSSADMAGVTDEPVKIGDPYQVNGRNYVPQEVKSYDEVGYASWYGADFEGQPTANGEIYVSQKISGAHKTLPLPTYVEVTALDTGRTILLRLNDRGPFSNDRLIDLSAGAAAQLGISDKGVAPVRVRKVNPPEGERAQLRRGGSVAERLPTPESLLKVLRSKLTAAPVAQIAPTELPPATVTAPEVKAAATKAAPAKKIEAAQQKAVEVAKAQPKGAAPAQTAAKPAPKASEAAAAAPAKAVSKGALMVQVGAFSSRSNAEKVAQAAGGSVYQSGKMFRVRTGPFANQAAANKGVAQAKAKGYSDARIVRAD